MDFRENNAVSALFPPQRPLCIVGRLGREKRERATDVSALLLFFIMDTKRELLRMRKVSATIGAQK